ncbi:hypothetical protein P0L94_01105 [Microbacter sp. GSS18]|nr:hypothetical protein P0L94_01105 [Microbacter sp. GSS18]
MTNTEPDLHLHGPLRTDDQLRLALEDLLMRASREQLWFIFLDEEDRLTGPFMPGDEYPEDPADEVDTDDLGTVPMARVLAVRLGFIAEVVDAHRVVLVWERPGPDELDDGTRAWVARMATECRAVDVRLRAQLLLHDEGLRMLVPDDYV